MRIKYVYMHLDCNGKVFYIGCGGKYRPHIVTGRSKAWNDAAIKGHSVEIVCELPMLEAIEKEKELILSYGLENLTNVSIGGDSIISFCDRIYEYNKSKNKN